ncbi:MAG: hypothetical protein AB7O37_04680 [Vicinamibacteria bacterium]
MKLYRSLLAAAALAAFCCNPEAAHAADLEPAPALKTAELLPKEQLSGPLHRVGETAPVVEYMPRYAISSRYGNSTAEGREMLEVRIREIAALAVRLAESEEDARFFRRNAEILARSHKGGQPLASIELRPALFAARARSGALLVPVPVDYLHLTDVAAEFAATPDAKGARREVRLSGVASAKVREALGAAKVGLRERVLEEPAK